MHRRKNLRLEHYDYAQEGFYFITICAQNRMKYFGEIDNGTLVLNDVGEMIDTLWLKTSLRFPSIKQHCYVIMPNHFHAIIEIESRANSCLGDIVGAFKSLTTNAYIKGVREKEWMPFPERLWQRNYYEHVIRNEESYVSLSEYINNNPLQWREDIFYT